VVAIDIAGGQKCKRNWSFVVGRRLLACHPDQLLLPHNLAAGEIIHARHQRYIDFAALHASNQRCG